MEDKLVEDTIRELNQLEAPQSYYCAIHLYYVGHSTLIIQADRGKAFENERLLFLTFINVVYFEGPLQWQGLRFYLGSSEECAEILDRIGMNNTLQELYYLFKVKLSSGFVKLVAMSLDYTNNPPAELLLWRGTD